MRIDKEVVLKLLLQVVGFVFLFSAFTKVLNVYAFQSLIMQMGLGSLHLLAPIVVLLELCIGLALLLQIKVRCISYLGIVTLLIFSLLYTYGYVVNGIVECGCFGNYLSVSSPLLVYVRNLILMLLLGLFVMRGSDFLPTKSDYRAKIIFCLVLAPSIFLSGMTYRVGDFSSYQHPLQGAKAEQTFLKSYTPNDGKTKLLFYFTENCSHCINSIANYNAFADVAMMDTIMAFMIVDEFHEIDTTEFSKKIAFDKLKFNQVLQSEVAEIDAYPMSFYVKNDTIQRVVIGQLPSPALFEY